ncbi:polysaccharide deacetylase family protein [Actinoplanes sp. HUAS TT8]|uniref:polysaccharide deacetylase family protein n=1 Tax=Actinoplanes sp. HUAS TT8 TaxID=3447453 RepID=UPI003F51ADFD
MSDEPRATTPGGASSDQPDAEPTRVTPDEEATVAIPADSAADEATAVIRAETSSDEATAAIPAEPAADEATVAMPIDAAPDATDPADAADTADTARADDSPDSPSSADSADPVDEATAVIPAETPADEATVAMTAETPADEATVAMTASAESDFSEMPEETTTVIPADEATVAMRIDTPRDEATVAIPAGRASEDATLAGLAGKTIDEATTVISGGARPSRATPVAPPAGTPEPAASRGFVVTRRRLLLGISGAGVAAAAAAFAVHSATDEPGKGAAEPVPGQPVVTRSRIPESAPVTAAPKPLPVQRKPISTLAEYTKATGGKPFPTDAIALTIDDGPHPVWTPKILQLLDKYQVPAMFCMIGNQVLGHEKTAQLVTGDGHQLANHTWSHPTELGEKPSRVARNEIRKAQAKITKTTGYVPKLFRSPGGDWSPQLLKDIAHAGLLPLDWSNDPRDWTMPGVATIEQRMLAAKPGQILLCHDGGGDRSQTYKALSVVIPALKARGLQFVAL